MKFLLIYFIIINLVSFFLMYYDKLCAQSNSWRIPEKLLFQVALLGGGVGGTLGIYKFRHKTKHAKFRYGFPIIAGVECLGMVWVIGWIFFQ